VIRTFTKKRIGIVAALAASAVATSSSPAAASVTIGQLAPGSSPPATCTNGPADLFQWTVGDGNTYVVPGTGRITSWSHNAAAGAGQMLTMKIFRQASGVIFSAVGHDGPRDLAPGTLNTFATNIPVKPGDIVGLNDANGATVNNACTFAATGSFFVGPDLADGTYSPFTGPFPDFRANLTAEFEPTNDFVVGGVIRKRNGTAGGLPQASAGLVS
jgi:hypothetical protein